MSIEPHSRVLIAGAASGLGLALVKQFVERGCRTFTPMMKQQGSGHIVNTASAAGLIHPPRMSEYNAVKAAEVIKGVEKNKHVILTDRNGRLAYAANRFARPVHCQMMSKVSRQMAAKD